MKFRSERGVAAIDLPLIMGFACATLTIACPDQVESIGCVFQKAGAGMDSVVASQTKQNLPVGYNQVRCGFPSWMLKPPPPSTLKGGGGSGSQA